MAMDTVTLTGGDTKDTALECPLMGFLQPREKESRGGSESRAGMKVWSRGLCPWKEDCSSRRDSGEWRRNAKAEMEVEHQHRDTACCAAGEKRKED